MFEWNGIAESWPSYIGRCIENVNEIILRSQTDFIGVGMQVESFSLQNATSSMVLKSYVIYAQLIFFLSSLSSFS